MTSRQDFNETWLAEMPSGIGKMSNDFFGTIQHSIYEYISHGGEPVTMANGYKKIFGNQVAYYWHENDEGTMDMAAELSARPQALTVNGVGRSPAGSAVHASDLYTVILKYNHKSIQLMSDEQLSDQGLNLWKRLLNLGNTISVYDRDNPTNLVKLNNEREMEQFFQQNSKEHRRWQYVLSEAGIKLAETNAYFNTRRMRQLSGLDTE